MGGVEMNSENMKNTDPLQLQQMIISLKSEVAKYKNQVDRYKDSDHYSLLVKLEHENNQLTYEKNELSKELFELKTEVEKQLSDSRDRMKADEIQNDKLVTLVDELQMKNAELWTMNKQLAETVRNTNYGLIVSQRGNRKQDRWISALHSKLADYKATTEQLEAKLAHSIQLMSKQLNSKIEELDRGKEKNSQSDLVNQHLLTEIEEKNRLIRKLQNEQFDLEETIEKYKTRNTLLNENQINGDAPSIENTLKTNDETLEQLEDQINKMLNQSADYEEKLNVKLVLLNELEHKLDQLTSEIADIKIIDDEGSEVLKDD